MLILLLKYTYICALNIIKSYDLDYYKLQNFIIKFLILII